MKFSCSTLTAPDGKNERIAYTCWPTVRFRYDVGPAKEPLVRHSVQSPCRSRRSPTETGSLRHTCVSHVKRHIVPKNPKAERPPGGLLYDAFPPLPPGSPKTRKHEPNTIFPWFSSPKMSVLSIPFATRAVPNTVTFT